MNDRAFRLDFFIAIAAVLISALTAGTLFYQTRVIGDEFAATIWPYLSVGTTYDAGGETIEVTNDGVGPALVRSAQLSVDGRKVGAWNDYIEALARDPELRNLFLRAQAAVQAGPAGHATITLSSIGPSSTLRPGESRTLLRISLPFSVPLHAMLKHAIVLDFCYCSLNGSCWTLHTIPGQINPDPASVSHCADRAAIQSNTVTAAPPAALPAR
ncbi:MAG TPA: hypothetical protein VKR56_16055 [Candidatus Cybelea sp.]|jgi:hypothetical protein|nr:hypothetical protein [Candidatus Cybelea sp.]